MSTYNKSLLNNIRSSSSTNQSHSNAEKPRCSSVPPSMMEMLSILQGDRLPVPAPPVGNSVESGFYTNEDQKIFLEETTLGKYVVASIDALCLRVDTRQCDFIAVHLDAKRKHTVTLSDEWKILDVYLMVFISGILSTLKKVVPKFLHIPPQSSFSSIASKMAKEEATSAAPLGETWNGDANYVSIGDDFISEMMELSTMCINEPTKPIKGSGTKRKGQAPTESDFEKKMSSHTVHEIKRRMQSLLDKVRVQPVISQAIHLDLIWRAIVFERAISNASRVAEGKGNKDIFYLLFTIMATEMRASALEMVKLIPRYGCFKDIDWLLNHYLECDNKPMVDALVAVYANALDADCRLLFSEKDGLLIRNGLTANMARINSLVEKLPLTLKNLTPEEIKTQYEGRKFSLVGKWLPRPDCGYSNQKARDEKRKEHGKEPLPDVRKRPFSSHYELVCAHVFCPGTQLVGWGNLSQNQRNFNERLMRKLVTSLNTILGTVEVRMAANQWEYIDPKAIPGAAFFQHRLALQNEIVGEELPSEMSETGNRTTDTERIKLRERCLAAAESGDIKFTGDSIKFAQECRKYKDFCIATASCGFGKVKISDATRKTLHSQFMALVEDIGKRVDSEYKEKYDKWVTDGSKPEDKPLNPRYCIGTIDVSGSMGERVFEAIVLGLILTKLSKLTTCFLTFHSRPTLIDVAEGDFYDWFIKAVQSPWGGSTNIDAANQLLLTLMKRVKAVDTEFNGRVSHVIFTDMQFNCQNAEIQSTRGAESDEDIWRPFAERMTYQFQQAGLDLPLTCFWNMNTKSPGFPVRGDTPGMIMVEGLSQGLFLSALGGGVGYEVDPETGVAKAAIDPKTSYLKRLARIDYLPVSHTLYRVAEGVFSDNINVIECQLFYARYL